MKLLIFRLKKLVNICLNLRYFSALIRHNVAAGVEHTAVLERFSDFECVIDVGANRGQFALVAKRVLPSARVFCFEPLAEPASILRQVFRGDDSVTCYEMALGSAAASLEMNVSARDDSSSLLRIGEGQTKFFPGTHSASTEAVTVCMLDDVLTPEMIGSRCLLKLDVQGYELEALKGASGLLGQCAAVYLEASFVTLYEDQPLVTEIITWMASNGFSLNGIHNLENALGVSVQADFLFVKTQF